MIHPFGLLYSEVTASSLQKINPDGSVVDQGSTNLGVNKAGILLHSAIHGARKDARAIIHLHQEDIVAVSLKIYCIKPVLLPVAFVAFVLFYARLFSDKLVLIFDTSCRYALHIFALDLDDILVSKISVVHFVSRVEVSVED